MQNHIAFIGFGEAAGAIVEGWGSGAGIRAYDVKTDASDTAAAKRADCARLGVDACAAPAAALSGAGLAFCAVTADQAVAAAAASAPHLAPGAFWFDLNSCAPSSTQRAAAIIEAAGARYVDVAVMSPIYPKRHKSPLLVGGPHAVAAAAALSALGMVPRVVEGGVGRASSIKMIRSIMVKGMEALTAECALAAVEAGVEDEVFASLSASCPGIDWPRQVAYNFERAMVHGTRRAAEMEEVAKTVRDLGFPPDMAEATVAWQARIGALQARPDSADYPQIARALTGRLTGGD
jgi:3-hydroxyisobutyrate dehydrogenase-like beta-hydroxyacid dehydrogenase